MVVVSITFIAIVLSVVAIIVVVSVVVVVRIIVFVVVVVVVVVMVVVAVVVEAMVVLITVASRMSRPASILEKEQSSFFMYPFRFSSWAQVHGTASSASFPPLNR